MLQKILYRELQIPNKNIYIILEILYNTYFLIIIKIKILNNFLLWFII